MIDLSTNCLFVHIPKTAGQSVESAFLENAGLSWMDRSRFLLKKNNSIKKGPPRLAHLTATEYTALGYLDVDVFSSLFKFCFVRNPFQRLVSEYQYQHSHIGFKKFVMEILPKLLTDDYDRNNGLNRHIMPQWKFIYDKKGKLLVDFVGRFENLQADFRVVTQKTMGKIVELPYRNASHHGFREKWFSKIKPLQNKEHYSRHYDSESRNFVEEFYREDINFFGYEFNTEKSTMGI